MKYDFHIVDVQPSTSKVLSSNDSSLSSLPDFLNSEEEYVPNFEDDGSSSDILDEELSDKVDEVLIEQDVDSSEVVENLFEEYTNPKTVKKVFSPRINNSKKRKCNPLLWKKRKAALERENGKAYLSYNNKLVPAKKIKVGILCREKCRLQCSTRFTEEDRTIFLNEFYKLDVNAKNALLFKCIYKKPVARKLTTAKKPKTYTYKYSVTKNGVAEEVCKEAFVSLYQISNKKVEIVRSKMNDNSTAPPPDCRGKHTTRPHKIDDDVKQFVMNHINKFPVEESHYSRHKNPHKKYLSPQLNQTKMHELYLEECESHNLPDRFKVKNKYYSNIFNTEFNLSFGQPKSDTCNICDAGESNEEHTENISKAFEAMKYDKEVAKTLKDLVFITMDLQQTMPLPKITAGKAFYLRQMWFYNFGMHIITSKFEKGCFCSWTEDIANRGSSEICSSLLRYIEVEENIQKNSDLVIWSDSCGGQNKNFSVICLYQYLILKGYFRRIDHKFPEVGHSYLDSDRDFGRIEKVLRKHDTVFVPEQYRQIIKKATKKNEVIDMTEHFRKIQDLAKNLNIMNRKKDELNEKVRFRDGIKWLRVEEYGSYLYKESYDNFMPFRKVNIIKNKRITELPKDIQIERHMVKYGTISDEKKSNLAEQLKYVKPQYRYFYEKILKD